jgi:hypothetical protein
VGDCRHPVTSMMRDNVYTYDWIFIELGFLEMCVRRVLRIGYTGVFCSYIY